MVAEAGPWHHAPGQLLHLATVVESEAMIRSAADLEALDRMLASLESRRNKALRCIAEYRGELVRQLQESSRIIEGKFLALENGSSNKRSAAARQWQLSAKLQRTAAARATAPVFALAAAENGRAAARTATVSLPAVPQAQSSQKLSKGSPTRSPGIPRMPPFSSTLARAAQAEFDLARIRQVKVAVIERMLALADSGVPQAFRSQSQIKRFPEAFDRGTMIVSEPVEAEGTMPSAEPEHSAEAMRRALPELIKLDRYERRAAALRERSMEPFW
jgi:hypothetical protein